MHAAIPGIKVVVNTRFGGASLSGKAARALGMHKGIDFNSVALADKYGWPMPNDRTDADLVRVVEEMGDAASGPSAHLVVKTMEVEIEIEDFDGKETVRLVGYAD